LELEVGLGSRDTIRLLEYERVIVVRLRLMDIDAGIVLVAW